MGDAGHILRTSRVGFEVRLEIGLAGDASSTPVLVTLTRAEATAKQLEEGQSVWIKAVAGASQIATAADRPATTAVPSPVPS